MATQPTPADFDTAYQEAVAYAKADVTHYDTLTFASSMDTGTVMIVADEASLTTNQGTYQPCAVEFTPAETEGGIVGQLNINITYLPPSAQGWLEEAAGNGANLTVIWRQYLAPNTDPSFVYRMPFDIIRAENVNGKFTLVATLPDLVNTPFCRQLMTPRILPGLAGL
nr:DUF1833 family protein [uncultured Desulfobulbus sp.]